MTDVKRLLAEATPTDEWVIWRYQNGGGRVSVDNRLIADFYEEGERELFLSARTHLPDYEAAVDALDHIERTTSDPFARVNARAALARLRGES